MKAIIIPGSPSSVTEMAKYPWIINLTEFVKKVYNNFKHIKILGISFGH
jgi:GMP synthase-like glutamine amidotransferase